MIQNVEQLGPELHVHSFTDSDPLQERRVHIEQARPTQCPASHVSEGPLGRQHEGSRIKPSIGCSQNHQPLEIRIPVRYVGITGIASSGSIEASEQCEKETACKPYAGVPLPVADQLVHDTSDAASEAPSIPERQLIAGVPIELVSETVGADTAVQLSAEIRAGKSRWLVSSGKNQNRGIQIHDLPPGVICLKREPAARALRQRDIHTMVARCTLIEPLSAAADVGVWPVSRRVVQRSLRHPHLLINWDWIAIRACPTADASLRVLADHG